ncbi:hypothetical protein STCU_10593 [Strigomonas culicis]|uniref:Uncharacterized protein n=1 Tax=Strigomonas culicis TaxID=28005 RepID=S9TME1_9TRYP|nr:hypothetical protein STCU_10593 [Strigomonas culicis]|eukprot:EPY17503.1 hypothetical protein STCU_10593 [Strigomonas culicis]
MFEVNGQQRRELRVGRTRRLPRRGAVPRIRAAPLAVRRVTAGRAAARQRRATPRLVAIRACGCAAWRRARGVAVAGAARVAARRLRRLPFCLALRRSVVAAAVVVPVMFVPSSFFLFLVVIVVVVVVLLAAAVVAAVAPPPRPVLRLLLFLVFTRVCNRVHFFLQLLTRIAVVGHGRLRVPVGPAPRGAMAAAALLAELKLDARIRVRRGAAACSMRCIVLPVPVHLVWLVASRICLVAAAAAIDVERNGSERIRCIGPTFAGAAMRPHRRYRPTRFVIPPTRARLAVVISMILFSFISIHRRFTELRVAARCCAVGGGLPCFHIRQQRGFRRIRATRRTVHVAGIEWGHNRTGGVTTTEWHHRRQ